MGRCNVGVAAAHPFSWLLSSPQQPLETEDPPTVSLAPQYTSQRLCRAIEFFGGTEARENSKILTMARFPNLLCVKIFHSASCKFFSVPLLSGSVSTSFTNPESRFLFGLPWRAFPHTR